MPELPEVETTVRQLKRKALNRAFVGVWSDWKKIIKKPVDFSVFEKQLKGKKIKNIWRRAKNIIFDLSGGYSLLVHQKMTGHLLYGTWEDKGKIWMPVNNKNLEDPYNRFLHVIFFLDDGKMIALSDVRKFAKVELQETINLKKDFEKLGPEPLDKDFTFEKFKKVLLWKNQPSPRLRHGKVKQVLMKPEIIAGIGNIYSSEILWQAKINPEKDVAKLNDLELKLLYHAIKKILTLSIKLGGESFSDYRKPDGTKGNFDSVKKVYGRAGQQCYRCKTKIQRIKIGQRSTFFCPNCQKS